MAGLPSVGRRLSRLYVICTRHEDGVSMVKTVSMVINQKSPFRKVLEETKGPRGHVPFDVVLTGDRTHRIVVRPRMFADVTPSLNIENTLNLAFQTNKRTWMWYIRNLSAP